ncbi:MAG: hypothetical protein M2R45_01327 [Verrucomicrobia subdivision 3 bacterium]|nr:hypothetical protein [Limisphaerales bacterium]MCS1415193.1 hypothetical protein [Limisphaerales bacterium]
MAEEIDRFTTMGNRADTIRKWLQEILDRKTGETK